MLTRNIVVVSSTFAVLSALIASACTTATCTELHRDCDGAGTAGLAGVAGVAGSIAGSDGGSENGGMAFGGSAGSGGAGGGASAGTGDAGAAGAPACADACKGLTPVCDAASSTCVQCLTSTDCKDSATPACDTTTNTCVQCITSTDCKNGAKPACDTAKNTCVGCVGNNDCKDATKPLCDTAAAQCVACLKQADCTSATASACSAGVCTACTVDADCSNIAGKGVCDAGTCVQCTGKKFAACGQDSGTPLVCDSLNRTCTTNKQHSVSACSSCVTDEQCQLGQLCGLQKFGGADVGYFCFWKKGDTANGAPADCFVNGRPYAATIANQHSIDGATADVCSLRTSTCVARSQFSLKDCKSGTAGSDALCGAAPPDDAKCDAVTMSTGYSCTMRCASDIDCPSGFPCNTGALQPYCEL